MVDVFISYARPDRDRAEQIRASLQALGLELFFDVHGIEGGATFPDVIDRALRASKAVLCCWSPQYFERRWCMIECRIGLDKNVLLPVAVRAFQNDALPADIRFVNYFNLADWDGRHEHESWLRTLKSLGDLVARDLVKSDAARSGAVPTRGLMASDFARRVISEVLGQSGLDALKVGDGDALYNLALDAMWDVRLDGWPAKALPVLQLAVELGCKAAADDINNGRFSSR